jgi:hypothetical protein
MMLHHGMLSSAHFFIERMVCILQPCRVSRYRGRVIQIDLQTPRTREIIGNMGKKKTKKQSAQTTLAEVIKEMARPRVAMSARTREQSHIVRNEVLVMKNDIEK